MFIQRSAHACAYVCTSVHVCGEQGDVLDEMSVKAKEKSFYFLLLKAVMGNTFIIKDI